MRTRARRFRVVILLAVVLVAATGARGVISRAADEAARKEATEALHRPGEPEAVVTVARLVEILEGEGQSAEGGRIGASGERRHDIKRYEAAMYLGRKSPEEGKQAIPVLRRALSDPDPAVRFHAAVALWRLEPEGPSPATHLADGLKSVDPVVGFWAAHAMTEGLELQASGDDSPEWKKLSGNTWAGLFLLPHVGRPPELYWHFVRTPDGHFLHQTQVGGSRGGKLQKPPEFKTHLKPVTVNPTHLKVDASDRNSGTWGIYHGRLIVPAVVRIGPGQWVYRRCHSRHRGGWDISSPPGMGDEYRFRFDADLRDLPSETQGSCQITHVHTRGLEGEQVDERLFSGPCTIVPVGLELAVQFGVMDYLNGPPQGPAKVRQNIVLRLDPRAGVGLLAEENTADLSQEEVSWWRANQLTQVLHAEQRPIGGSPLLGAVRPSPAAPADHAGAGRGVGAAAERSPEWAQPIERPGLPNFWQVSDRLYRGAQPTAEGMRELKAMGVKTVVNLRSFHSDRDEIGQTALAYEHIYMKSWHAEDEDVVRFLQIVTDPARTPAFVHCEHGADRTGTMCAIYRIAVQGWDKEEAIREMTEGGFGFHSIHMNLPAYIRKLDVEKIKALSLIHI